MKSIEPRRSVWLRPVTKPLDPQAVALRGVTLAAAGVSLVWLALGFASLGLLVLTSWAAMCIAVVQMGAATLMATVYCHLLNGPTAVRLAPRQWVTTLGSIGPITVAMMAAQSVLLTLPATPMEAVVIGGLNLAAGAGAMVLAPFGVLPLDALWRRAYRSDNSAAFVTAVGGAGLCLTHLVLLLWLL